MYQVRFRFQDSNLVDANLIVHNPLKKTALEIFIFLRQIVHRYDSILSLLQLLLDCEEYTVIFVGLLS